MYPHAGLAVQPHSSGGSGRHICMDKQESSGKYKHFSALIADGIDFPCPAISQCGCIYCPGCAARDELLEAQFSYGSLRPESVHGEAG